MLSKLCQKAAAHPARDPLSVCFVGTRSAQRWLRSRRAAPGGSLWAEGLAPLPWVAMLGRSFREGSEVWLTELLPHRAVKTGSNGFPSCV